MMEANKSSTTNTYCVIDIEQRNGMRNTLLLESFEGCKVEEKALYVNKNYILEEKTSSIFFWLRDEYRIYRDILNISIEEIEFETLDDAKLYFELIT